MSGSPQPDQNRASSRIARRGLFLGGAVALALTGAGAAQWFNINAEINEQSLSTPDALAAAEAGQITLVDIRRPDEWANTGVPKAGIPLDMRRNDFIDVLLSQPNVDKDRPIALICARGVRSRRMSERLTAAGFTKIIDVPEGMLGSGAGPGWLKRGLPVVKP